MAELIAEVGRALARLGRTVFTWRSEATGTEAPPCDSGLAAARPVVEVRALLGVGTGGGGSSTGNGAGNFYITLGTGSPVGYLFLRNMNVSAAPGAGVGTLTNAPAAGNPQTWLQVSINGTVHWIPAWHA